MTHDYPCAQAFVSADALPASRTRSYEGSGWTASAPQCGRRAAARDREEACAPIVVRDQGVFCLIDVLGSTLRGQAVYIRRVDSAGARIGDVWCIQIIWLVVRSPTIPNPADRHSWRRSLPTAGAWRIPFLKVRDLRFASTRGDSHRHAAVPATTISTRDRSFRRSTRGPRGGVVYLTGSGPPRAAALYRIPVDTTPCSRWNIPARSVRTRRQRDCHLPTYRSAARSALRYDRPRSERRGRRLADRHPSGPCFLCEPRPIGGHPFPAYQSRLGGRCRTESCGASRFRAFSLDCDATLNRSPCGVAARRGAGTSLHPAEIK